MNSVEPGPLRWPGGPSGNVVTVGSFDGVHRGHWQLLQIVTATATQLQRPALLVTFDPHPLAIVRPDRAPPLLSTPTEKIEVLAESGLHYLVFLRFDRQLADYSPRRFVEEILIGRFRMSHLVIGYDHGFGKDRSGDARTLARIGEELGFAVDIVPAVGESEQPISSTAIRKALQSGDVSAAARALGRPYSLRATVIRGDGRGASLGFPTANLRPPDSRKLIPRPGIYAVRAQLAGRQAEGVLHIGPRPTFPGAEPTIELHLFDFSADLYGRDLTVSFCAFIRDVERFDSVEALIAVMEADCAAARRLLAEASGACHGADNSVSFHG
ncbi:MAG: bifunctional riboflavin kinase/FAD synthetase [Gemmatimonadetes bacterium]|nr:bifunctional riboflavin kinase/FAD synthetase [Gemmatimonadota bacterium]